MPLDFTFDISFEDYVAKHGAKCTCGVLARHVHPTAHTDGCALRAFHAKWFEDGQNLYRRIREIEKEKRVATEDPTFLVK